MKEVAIFWPGDYRAGVSEASIPYLRLVTRQMEQALRKLGRTPYLVDGIISNPVDAIKHLRPIEEPIVALFVNHAHSKALYDGVANKDNPLLLAATFSGAWPGMVSMLPASAGLQAMNRQHVRIWSAAADWTQDSFFMDRLSEWCHHGKIKYSEDELRTTTPLRSDSIQLAEHVAHSIRRDHLFFLNVGIPSSELLPATISPTLLYRLGITQDAVDSLEIVERSRAIAQTRAEHALHFLLDHGVTFHWEEKSSPGFTKEHVLQQLTTYLSVEDLINDRGVECLSWNPLGIPDSAFILSLLSSFCRPESNGKVIVSAPSGDTGVLIPQELMRRILLARGLPPAVMSQEIRWGGVFGGRFIWLFLNPGGSPWHSLNQDQPTLKSVHVYRQLPRYSAMPVGTFTSESPPGKITWARMYQDQNQLVMDVGKGEAISLPPTLRDVWWEDTARIWPFLAADLGCGMETIMAHGMSNRLAIAYGDVLEEMAALGYTLGIRVRIVGRLGV